MSIPPPAAPVPPKGPRVLVAGVAVSRDRLKIAIHGWAGVGAPLRADRIMTRSEPGPGEQQQRGGPPPSQGTRSAAFTASSYNASERTVEAVFSAGSRVRRWFGFEELAIEDAAVDLTRVQRNICPFLNSHNQWDIGATLGTYIDETPFGSSTSLANGAVTTPNIDTFDMARVEVLRGPQGTLYGATTLGGLLKFVTNPPDPSGFDDLVQVGVDDVAHGGTGWSGKAMLNVPLADNAAVRGVIYHDDQSGFIDDPARGKKDINGTNDTGGRLSLLWNVTPDFTVRLNALMQNLTIDGSSAVDTTYVPSATSPSGLAYGLKPFSGPYEQSRTAPEPSTVRYRLYNGTVDWNLGFGTLTSATSYGEFTDHSSQDVTALYGTLLFTDFRQKKFTQELRLASPEGEKLEWLAGFYYTHETEGQLQNIAPARHAVGLGTLTFDSGYAETAGFLDFTYHFTDAFDLAVGGRYAGNSQHANEYGLASAKGDSSENVFTWSVAPSWHIDDLRVMP